MVRIIQLEWDDGNEEHIARHSVQRKEVEDVCFGRHWAIRSRERIALFGQTTGGRYLLVIVERLGSGAYRPVTAREMNATEKRAYRVRGSRR